MTHGVIKISKRFRGYLPVVVDIETGGLNNKTDAVLEIAAVILDMDNNGELFIEKSYTHHVEPFYGANLDSEALKFTGIDPYHPFRFALPESDALDEVFTPIYKAIKEKQCRRAILVGHNPMFDLGFLSSAMKRCGIKRGPFHSFTTFDTATLSGLALGHTVLAVSAKKAGIIFDEQYAHSALYDAEKTAELFCFIVNKWKKLTECEKY